MIAESACTEGRRWFKWFKKANRLERIWANVRAAEVNLLALSSDDELRAYCGLIKAMVRRYIQEESPQRIEAEKSLKRIIGDRARKISPQDRVAVIHALGISYSALDARTRRVRILANVLWLGSLFTFMGAAAVAIWGWLDPQTLSLCFEHPEERDLINGDTPDSNADATPDANAETPDDLDGVIVCPTGEELIGPKRFADDYADPLDVLSVELAGLVGAALTTIAAIRRVQDDHTSPYALPLAAATLKFPLGALSAFVGIIFIRGAFLPGLSALDTPIQILAWAILFGAAQHLVTHLIDEKAQSTLSSIGRSPRPPRETPSNTA
ncbi:hypothetical protein ACFY5C_11705 [Streptomyces sp. NPDC012935]|uniref:hypothetical protein n=1 Tax=Streptomyces sp. NPDC012935 TaxID=3364857 RepID=UPI0036A3D1BD